MEKIVIERELSTKNLAPIFLGKCGSIPAVVKLLNITQEAELYGQYREMWKREVDSLKRCNDAGLKNVVKLLGCGETGETALSAPAGINPFQLKGLYLAVELYKGETLEDALRPEGMVAKLDFKARIHALMSIAQVFKSIHELEITHRDIKPANILVNVTPTSTLDIKIIDFGISKLHDKSDSPHTIVGNTPKYASPEQLRGLKAGPASDVFSFGLLATRVLSPGIRLEEAHGEKRWIDVELAKLRSGVEKEIGVSHRTAADSVLGLIGDCLALNASDRAFGFGRIYERLSETAAALSDHASGDRISTNASSGIRAVERLLVDMLRFKRAPNPDEQLAMGKALAHQLCTEMALPDFEEDPWQALFKGCHRKSGLVAAAVLRMLAIDDSRFIVAEQRRKIIELFSVAWPDIPAVEAIMGNKDLQTHQKLSQMCSHVSLAEDALRELIGRPLILELHHLETWLKDLMKVCRGNKTGFIIAPFLPAGFPVLLTSAIASLSAYSDADETGLIQARDTVVDRLEKMKSSGMYSDTEYARKVLVDTANKLQGMVDDHFRQSPYAKPAVVEVRIARKRYPLHEAHHKMRLRVIVENKGPGIARNLTLQVDSDSYNVIFSNKEPVNLGTFLPGRREVEFAIETLEATPSINAYAIVKWDNIDKTEKDDIFMLEFGAQSRNIKWDELRDSGAWSQEPVDSRIDLIGRDEAYKDLRAEVIKQGVDVGSALIQGQKRVGKTSLIRTLIKEEIYKSKREKFFVCELMWGEWAASRPEQAVSYLGERICLQILKKSKAAGLNLSVGVPQFEGSLAPLGQFFDDLLSIEPDLRVLIVLDEFDEILPALYQEPAIANPFFQTLRSISHIRQIGIVLIGSEKMTRVFRHHGAAVNKFKSIKLSYLQKESQWPDFTDLVRRPFQAMNVDVDDVALEEIYRLTAGNPYFVKVLGDSIRVGAYESRDGYITDREVKRASRRAILNSSETAFIHFWTDGLPDDAQRDHERYLRAKTLLAFSESLNRHGGRESQQAIGEIAAGWGLREEEWQPTLDDFIQRGVLVRDSGSDRIHCPVGLFEEWLADRGIQQIEAGDSRVLEERRKLDASLVVKEGEIEKLLQNWGGFRGNRIEVYSLVEWLRQFGAVRNQRLIFRSLGAIRVFDKGQMRNTFPYVHQQVRESTDLVLRLKEGQLKDKETFITSLHNDDNLARGMAGIYADVCKISTQNLVRHESLGRLTSKNVENSALVVAVDFLVDKAAAVSAVNELLSKETLRGYVGPIGVVACAARAELLERLNAEYAGKKVPVKFFSALQVNSKERMFGEKIFQNETEQAEVVEIAKRYCHESADLALGDEDALWPVVLDDNCSRLLPAIFWQKAKSWRPLFDS